VLTSALCSTQVTRHPALGLKSNGPSRATQSILGELKMTLYAPTGVKTGSYQLKRPIKPARALTGSPSIMLPNGPECLKCECVGLRRQLVKKNMGLKRHSQRKSMVIDKTAHDLRGLISGIPNASNYLLGEAHGLPEDHLPLWGGIAAPSNFILSLNEDIVQFSEIETREHRWALQPTDLLWLTDQSFSRKRLLADTKIRLEIVDSALPLVRVDPLRMHQAVDSLATTAITFSKPGSKIEVRMHAQNDVVSIAVRDEGPGSRRLNKERFSRPSGGASLHRRHRTLNLGGSKDIRGPWGCILALGILIMLFGVVCSVDDVTGTFVIVLALGRRKD
jgi:histidine kinase/DNA gyrase B/HSP90-like ATPase